MTFFILYGDKRQLYLAEMLRREGHSVTHITGDGDGAREAPGRLCDAVILPIPASRDGLHITGSELLLSEVCARLSPTCLLLGGRLPKACHSLVGDYLSDESFTLGNADLTAEGTLRLLYENTEKALSETAVTILGYGRIAKLLLLRLRVLTRRVTVVARRPEARTEAALLGADALPFGSFLPRADVVINTVPPPFSVPPVGDALLIDLAGLPADSFPAAGERLLPAPALPGRFFPVSAARILYDTTLRFLERRLDPL